MHCHLNTGRHTHSHTAPTPIIFFLQAYHSAVSLPLLLLFQFPPTQVKPGEDCLYGYGYVHVCKRERESCGSVTFFLSIYVSKGVLQCIYQDPCMHLCAKICACLNAFLPVCTGLWVYVCLNGFQDTKERQINITISKSPSALGTAGKEGTEHAGVTRICDCVCLCVFISAWYGSMSKHVHLCMPACFCNCDRRNVCEVCVHERANLNTVQPGMKWSSLVDMIQYYIVVLCSYFVFPDNQSRPEL